MTTAVKVKKVTGKEVLEKEWVFNNNGQAMTDSQTVAFVFGKEHKAVLRDIRKIVATADTAFGENNYAPSTYTTEQNKQAPKYLLTENGFTLLVMGYTGTAAMKYKVEYINRFHAMREQLHSQLPGAVQEYLGLGENERAIAFFQQRLQLDEHKKELKASRPKARFHDEFVNAKGLQTVSEVAKTLGTGRDRFFKWMREQGIVQQDNKPYQQYMNKQYFQIKQYKYKRSGHVAGTSTTLFTAKGVAWIAEKYLKAGCPAN